MENTLPSLLLKTSLNALAYLVFLPLIFQFKKTYSPQDFIELKSSFFYFLKKYKWVLLGLFGIYSTISFLYPFGVDEVWIFSYFYKKPALSPFVFYDLPSNHILYSNVSILFTYIWNSIYTWRLVSCIFLSLSVVFYYHFLTKKLPKKAVAISIIYACLPMVINAGIHAKGYALISCILLCQLLLPQLKSIFYWIGTLVHPVFLLFGWLPLFFTEGKNAFNKRNILVFLSGIAFYTLLYQINDVPHQPRTLSLSYFLLEINHSLVKGLISLPYLRWTGTLLLLTVLFLTIYQKEKFSVYLLLFTINAIVGFYIFSFKIIHYRMLITLPLLISFVVGQFIKNKVLLIGIAGLLIINFFMSERILVRYKQHKFLVETAKNIISSPELRDQHINTNLERLSTYVEYYSVKNKIPYKWRISTEFQQADTTFYFQQ